MVAVECLCTKAEHPQTNPKTVCATKASGQVSFLVQNLQGPSHYSCTIPAKNAIMIPISTGSCTSIEAHSSKPADLINCATIGDQHLTFKATLDGVPLNNLQNNYAITKIFDMTYQMIITNFLKVALTRLGLVVTLFF